MSLLIVGLGNPGAEYAKTRHNAGRMVVEKLARSLELGAWSFDKKLNAQKAKGKSPAGGRKTAVELILPEGMMNNSGRSLKPLITGAKQAERLVVVHDDLDLPLGKIKLSFDRGAGGHRGVESVVVAIRTAKFTRLRVGICPATPGGKLKKPKGEKAVIDFILKPFRLAEEPVLKKILQTAVAALETLAAEGRDQAMARYNR